VAELAQKELEEKEAAAKQVFVTNKGDDAGSEPPICHLRQPRM
jgi:hypothetical protein